MKRTHIYALPILSVFYLLFALASCRMPNNPKPPDPPPSDSCCHGKLTIHVVDASGKPVPGAPVQMTTADGKVVTGKADANGVVTFDGLCPGKYSVSMPTNSAGTKNGEPTTVQMGCNDKKEIKLRTGSTPPPPPPPPPPPSDSCCHGHMVIHVVDANGQAVINAGVTIKGSDGSMHQAKTDANGNVILDGLCPGKYTITVGTSNTPQPSTTTVEMGCNDKKEVKLRTANTPPPPPPPDSCCNGRLVVHVTDANGNPVPHAPVNLKGSNGQMFSGQTDDNGTAVFEHLCDGVYAIISTTQSPAGGTQSGSSRVEMGCNDQQEVKMVVTGNTR